MNRPLRIELPVVTEEDVDWVSDVLQLPKTAFRGASGDDPRLAILRSNETLDIEACPGSGKTTLLVAKLAILARKWTDRRRGICILSHTKVARREIERLLGNTTAGRSLLRYPHFVGTIHGFTNEFLAMPWLRSLGYPVNVIDDYHCEQHRRRLLNLAQFGALCSYVSPREASGKLNVVAGWCITSPTFDVVRSNGAAEFKSQTGPAARQLRLLAKKCAGDGFHTYDEMFMWGRDLLDKVPDIRAAIRERFPVLFIDEVQDNSEEQSSLLFRLLIEGDDPVIRQRFGDANQAIYRHAGQTDGAKTDPFPSRRVRVDIPNSHRFGQEIGNIANPLALEPQNLVGCGPPVGNVASDTKRQHAIFLFSDLTAKYVMAAYASYLQELFTEHELCVGVFTAIGGVHRPGKNDNLPRSVGHYWSEYDHELTGAEPMPTKTFFQYLMAGRKLAYPSAEVYHVVEKFAAGIVQLARLANPAADLGKRRRTHRQILELLANLPEIQRTYLELVTCFAIEELDPSSEEWSSKWAEAIRQVAESVGGRKANSQAASAFLQWRLPGDYTQQSTSSLQRDNLFRHPTATPKVKIRVGSIHSAKGETHTATLVLDTYFHEHHLDALKPWLLGQKLGKGKEGPRNVSRLKQHYVAMTRPTHLLCLAMREDAFNREEIEMLKGRSWRVARVTGAAPVWL